MESLIRAVAATAMLVLIALPAAAQYPTKPVRFGIEITGSTPEALQAEVVDEVAKWTKVIKDANIKPE